MTYLEVLYKDTGVLVYTMKAKSGKIHTYVRDYCGKYGLVIGESKGGQLLIQFSGGHRRCIPPGCVQISETVIIAEN